MYWGATVHTAVRRWSSAAWAHWFDARSAGVAMSCTWRGLTTETRRSEYAATRSACDGARPHPPPARVRSASGRHLRRVASAPDGHFATCATIASSDAPVIATHGLRFTSKTAGRPRTQTPECVHTFGSNVTTNV